MNRDRTLSAPEERMTVLERHAGTLFVALITLLTTLAALVIGVVCLGVPLNFDCALLLDFGRLILRGGMPYVEYVDINPPITHYVHIVPVWLAGIFGAKIETVFQLAVLSLVLCSTALFSVWLAKSPTAFSISARLFITASWLTFSILVLKRLEFGEREHLFVLSYLPWLYLREARYTGRPAHVWLAALTGMVVAPFALMKPHFCFLVLIMEAFMLLRYRRTSCLYSPEVFAALAVTIAYGLHFLFVPGSMIEEYFGRWLPLAAANYHVANCSTEQLFWNLITVRDPTGRFLPTALIVPAATLCAVFVIGISSKRAAGRRSQLQIFGGVTLLSLGIYILQHKGWSYHLIPATGFGTLLLATFAMTLLDRPALSRKIAARVAVAAFNGLCVAVAVLAVLMLLKISRLEQSFPGTECFVELIQAHTEPGDRIAFISNHVTPAYPTLIVTNRLPGTRFLHAWPIPMYYAGMGCGADGRFPYRSPPNQNNEERRFLNELGGDISRLNPKLILIDTQLHQEFSPKGFSVYNYLSETGWIDRFLSDYRLQKRVDGFVMYSRRESSPLPQ